MLVLWIDELRWVFTIGLKSVHKLIKKVSEDIEKISYNTSISAFMIAVNVLRQQKCRNKELLTDLVILIAPFAPHIAKELWAALGELDCLTVFGLKAC